MGDFVENKAALQELYAELDVLPGGTQRLAVYGQLRALGHEHREAIDMIKSGRA